MRLRIAILALLLVTASGARAGAQVLALHGVFVPGTDERRGSTGVEFEVGGLVASRYATLLPTLALEYQRQHDYGPGRGRVAGQLRFLPRNGRGYAVPFVGVSVSANQSGGGQSEWSRTRGGIEGMAGLLLIASETFPLAILAEERFGYVRGQNHALATHIGLGLSF